MTPGDDTNEKTWRREEVTPGSHLSVSLPGGRSCGLCLSFACCWATTSFSSACPKLLLHLSFKCPQDRVQTLCRSAGLSGMSVLTSTRIGTTVDMGATTEMETYMPHSASLAIRCPHVSLRHSHHGQHPSAGPHVATGAGLGLVPSDTCCQCEMPKVSDSL